MIVYSSFHVIILVAVATLVGFGFFCFVRMLDKVLPRCQFFRFPFVHRLVFLFLMVFAFFTAVPKTTNETGRANAPARSQPMRGPLVQSEDEVADSEADVLRFTSISVDIPNDVRFSVHVPDDQEDPRFDLFTRPRLDEGGWEFFDRYNSLESDSFTIPFWELGQFYGNDDSYSVPALAFFKLGDLSDEDGDGLTDAFELLVFGSEPGLPDSDFDGIDDYYEYLHGSPHDEPDADGDGLSDLVEKGGIVVGNRLPWFSAVGATDLTALFPDADCSFVDYRLPAGTSVNVNGSIYDSLRIDLNGAVHLNRVGETDEQWAEDVPTDFGRNTDYGAAPVLAPFWTDFELAADSSVKVFIATYGGSSFHVVEFSNMKLCPSWEPDLETASFQLAIPQGVATEVYVRFGTLASFGHEGEKISACSDAI